MPIHIIMDRTTGKTMDCYVEFFSYGDAQAAFNKCLLRSSQLRLGDRVVDVTMSSQDALLSDLFPKAKNVEWQHGRPIIRDSDEPYNSGFKSFVTNEELLQLVSHAEKPHRVSNASVDVLSFRISNFDAPAQICESWFQITKRFSFSWGLNRRIACCQRINSATKSFHRLFHGSLRLYLKHDTSSTV